jgi:hypothetical protein
LLSLKKTIECFFYAENKSQYRCTFFVDKLNLSTNYFGDLIKHHTGKTPSEIIPKIIMEQNFAIDVN